MFGWLHRHSGVAEWIQAFGVIGALIFGVTQLEQAKEALQSSAKSNEIALQSDTRTLLTEINMAALQNPEIAGNYPGERRLHLIRLQYFDRVCNLRQQGLYSTGEFRAETAYLAWAVELTDFRLVWADFRDQYHEDLVQWVDGVILANDSSGDANAAQFCRSNIKLEAKEDKPGFFKRTFSRVRGWF